MLGFKYLFGIVARMSAHHLLKAHVGAGMIQLTGLHGGKSTVSPGAISMGFVALCSLGGKYKRPAVV